VITPSQRWFVGAVALALVAPLGYVWPPTLALLLALDALWVAALLVDVWRSERPAHALEVTRIPPPAFSVGRPLPVTYLWRNRTSRRVSLRVREEFPGNVQPSPAPHSREMHPVVPGVSASALEVHERSIEIAASSESREEILVRPLRRGVAEAGRLHVRLLSPWGLAWRQERLAQPWKVMVYPNLVGASLRSLPTQLQRRREAGLRAVRRIGEGRIFESLKEWVPGDDVRTIDWKATARRGKPMARQYEDERRQQVLIVIDAGRMLTAEIDGRSRLDSVVDAALRLAHSAVDHDDNVGVMVFAGEVRHFVPPARGRRALRAVLDALATTEGELVEPNYPAAFAYLQARNRKRSLMVLFTDVIDRTASDAMLTHLVSLRPRHVPLAVTLRDPRLEHVATARPETVSQAFERAAAEELLLARSEALASVRRRRVLILDVLPADAARAVVDKYTELKRRALV
jgi:uncharacterized protein (DUF58 family)